MMRVDSIPKSNNPGAFINLLIASFNAPNAHLKRNGAVEDQANSTNLGSDFSRTSSVAFH